jgi:hypothetical protein
MEEERRRDERLRRGGERGEERGERRGGREELRPQQKGEEVVGRVKLQDEVELS